MHSIYSVYTVYTYMLYKCIYWKKNSETSACALDVNTAVPLGHDRTTICEKNANFDDRGMIVYVAVRSYHGRGEVFKIVKSVPNFEHV